MSAFRLASAQFPVSEPRSWQDYAAQLAQWTGIAAANGARLLVYPEYAAMSLTALFDARIRSDLALQVDALQEFCDDYLQLHRRLAQQHGLYLIAGSFPWRLDPQRVVNRAWICAPDGRCDWQDKQIMTRFERENWGIASARDAAGSGLKVFHTALGTLAINLCYDSEFPLLARAQCEAGTELIAVPSCTDTPAGYHRVRVGCQARALENQCYVAQSPLVGEAPWSPAIDINVGAAGVFGPPDRGFPDDGIVALGEREQPAWVYAEVDLAAVARVRGEGQVFNHRHWGEQDVSALPPVHSVEL